MDMHNSYVNTLSSYGFNDKDYFETYPEERRKWRKAIKQHVDDAMGITDEEINNGDNMTVRLKNVTGVSDDDLANGNNLSKKLQDARDNINTNVDNRTTEIKEYIENVTGITESDINSGKTLKKKIDDVKGVVDEINTHIGWNNQQNKTVTARLAEIKTDTASLLNKLPDNVYHNYL